MNNFLDDLSEPARGLFEKICHAAMYPTDAFLFMQGQKPRGIYVLCSGRVKLLLTSGSGKTMIIKMAEPGEVLGLYACISGRPHDTTAETAKPSEVNFVKREDFLRFLRVQVAAGLLVAEHLSAEYHHALKMLRTRTASQAAKLAQHLLESSSGGKETAEGVRFRTTLSHQELGEIIGASRETVTRLLAQFKRQKLIESYGGSIIIIRDRAGLEEIGREVRMQGEFTTIPR